MLTDTDPAAPQMVLIGEGDNVPQALLNAANSVVALSVRTPPRTIESRCMSPEVARSCQTWMSAMRSLTGANRTWCWPPDLVENDPLRKWGASSPRTACRALFKRLTPIGMGALPWPPSA